MHVIKVELPGSLRSADPSVSLASDEIRAQLYRQMEAIDHELSEHVRQRASSYFPPTYSVFVRTLLPEHLHTMTELWIVDPGTRWPQGLLTRSAWRLLVPMLAHTVREAYQARLEGVAVAIEEKEAKITVLAPAHGWRDPFLLGGLVFLATTLLWLIVQPWISDLVSRLVR